MYQPDKYKKRNPQYIYDFIKAHPFATFVINGERLLATHIPVLISGSPEKFTLYAHIANHNEQLRYLKDGSEALLIFQGAHGYISSSWYKEKNISTWDYSAVHINIKIKLQTEKELISSLDDLVRNFENEQEAPLFYKDIPEKMVKEHLPLITGFWGEPFKIQAVAKLHQAYDPEDVGSVTEHLERSKSPMETCLSKEIKKEHGI